MAVNLTFTSPAGAYTFTNFGEGYNTEYPTILATPTALEIQDGSDINFEGYQGDSAFLELSYFRLPDYSPKYVADVASVGLVTRYAYFNSPVTAGAGNIGSSDPWVIATVAPVPEPATLSLVMAALLGLGGVYLRRRAAGALTIAGKHEVHEET